MIIAPPSGPHQKNRELCDYWRRAEWAGQRFCSLGNTHFLLTLTFNSLTDFHERLTHQCSSTDFGTCFALTMAPALPRGPCFVDLCRSQQRWDGLAWHLDQEVIVLVLSLSGLNSKLFPIPRLFMQHHHCVKIRQFEFLGADTSFSEDGVKYFKV